MNVEPLRGFDIWFMPDPAGLTYGDDAPGFWLNGNYDSFDFSLLYHKASESNWGIGPNDDHFETAKDEDRDIYAGYLTYNLTEGHDLTGLYMFDRIRNVPTGSLTQRLGSLTDEDAQPETDVHYLGAIYKGKAGMFNYFLEGIYRFGEAEDVSANTVINPDMTDEDYDISAFAAAGDVEMDLSDSLGYGIKPHLGFIYTSGDDDPTDGDLEGYDGALSFQRFTKFGGENCIPSDTNVMMGTAVYSFLPGLYGNGTPIITGGLSNGNPLGTSRGDNPGLTMTSFGFTMKPRFDMTFKTNVNSFWWNEDISVPSFNAPPLIPGEQSPTGNPLPVQNTIVENDYVGTELDSEFTLAMSRHSFIKFQGAVLFPGEMLEEATAARTATLGAFDPQTGQMQVEPGEESDEVAYRLAMEFIWQF
ncbi:MAG: alginate export family protein [Desulfosalsimonadaceae bacterium]